jgi:hypothetical protein
MACVIYEMISQSLNFTLNTFNMSTICYMFKRLNDIQHLACIVNGPTSIFLMEVEIMMLVTAVLGHSTS